MESNPVFVTDDELQRMFHEGNYYQRMLDGEFYVELIAEWKPRRANHQAPGTVSQRLEWFDFDGNLIARVHQYRRRDGTLGGSGMPDPKRLVHNGIDYVLDDGEYLDDEW